MDNDVPVHDLNGLEKWLAKGKKQMAKLFGLSSSDKTTQRGPYKKKGTVQSIRTQQHNKKKQRDWTAKMQNGGFGDLRVLFGGMSPKQQTPALREVLEIDSDSDTMDGEHDIPMVTPVDGPEREEDNLGDIPEVVWDNVETIPEWTPSQPRPILPPNPDLVDLRISNLEQILRPKRKAGDGYMDPGFDYTLRTRLELMANFLRIYRLNEYQGWIAASKQAASIAGKNPEWMARQLCEWTHDFVHDPTNLPKHEYGKFNSSILEDEDLAQEICLHLQSKGKYVCAMDVVRFLDTPEMKERLNLKKSISEQTARRWMATMGYRWKKEPKGQYKDGHERKDVVSYRQNVFLPFMTSIRPHMRQWTKEGALETISEAAEGPPPPFLQGSGRWIVIWVHDESTFYANDRRVLRWVHSSESAKPYAKGEGPSQMVADFVSPDYGWLQANNG